MKRLVATVLLTALAALATAETIPPGDYSDAGRVVRTSHGSIELFDGHGCRLLLSPELQEKLEPHLGEFVRVDYTRVEPREGLLADMTGAPIGKIRKVTTLAKDAQSLPVEISVRPLEERVALGDPVRVEVSATSRTGSSLELNLGEGECHLLQDYRGRTSLAPERSMTSRRPNSFTRLARSQSVVRTIESAWMAKPGTYDIVFTLRRDDGQVALQSDLAQVTVLPAADADEERAALLDWLTRASVSQRIEIARRLIAHGDRSGVDEVLRLFTARSAWGSYTYAPAYRFLWEHGGERGEEAMLAELSRCKGQDRALRVIENVHLSPRKLPLLEKLLADRGETARSHSGWCARPRIADITAAWLVGYTDYEMSFPESGSVAERDAAVESVRTVLRDDPTRFAVLRPDWQ